MSDPLNREALPDDLFRNRIAAALRELDQPESDADIAAALDAIDAEPLSDAAMQRILRQVRRSIAASTVVALHDSGRNPPPAPRMSQMGIVALCASALFAAGLVFFGLDDVKQSPLRPGELMSSTDRLPGSRSSPAEQSPNSAAIQRVKLGETLSTGLREKRRVTLLDGSVLSINEQSQVTISGERRVKLLAGEVFVEVMPTKSSERFIVETPHRTVTALGTKFVVKAQGESTNVVVTQGKVQVSGVDEVIPAGHELIADLTESKSAELRPAKRSAYVVEWVKDLMAAAGSVVVPTSEHAGGTITVVDPQGQEMKLSLRKFHVDVHIEDGFARTTIDQTYFNHTWQQLEGTFRFPLPADASLSRLAMYVNGTLMEGGMVERDYGRNVFEQIRHTRRDPALLEWVDGSTFQMRVFPLEARQEKRILLSYTQRLPSDYGKSVYRFPTGHSLEGVREWSTLLRVKGAAGMKWYSPSHLLNGRDEQGDLLIEGRDEYAALDRDLVVELGGEPRPTSLKTEPTWAACEQDGFQYVMLRQRPELQANAERPQRQWIFLIENSADRNEVLAETQRQIVKVLLDNAEHSDTFSIIRAGTQAESFRRKPVECSLDNVAASQQFLNEVAPIGALDLEQALREVQQQVRGNRDVWIVHLGTGIPVLGERDETTLLRLVPAKARYVGVAVGKRWSKSFMETAASHSGGHVTQINPDEAVAWRAFDLLSTLNAPRLTEIAVRSSDVASGSEFLLLTNSLAHGQELAAIARFPKGQALPKSVAISGKLDGKSYSQTVAIPQSPIAPQSGHLPRTWARLEIDRLVALGAAEHKLQIIELSKAMYVMSPFTSLLVLETEAMYEQFKVDRGRKDHWAMYPAPAQIPVVADGGPSQLTPLDAAKERLQLAQARAKTAQSNYERSVAEKRPATDLKRLERLNRAEQAEVRLVENEIQRIERANDAAANPVRKAWESVVLRRSAWQQGYLQMARNHWNYWGKPTYWEDSGLSFRGDLTGEDFGIATWGGDINGNGVLNFDGLLSQPVDRNQGDVSWENSFGANSARGRRRHWAMQHPPVLSFSLESSPESFFAKPLHGRMNINVLSRPELVDRLLTEQSDFEFRWRQQSNERGTQGPPAAYYMDDDVQYFPTYPEQKSASQSLALARYGFQPLDFTSDFLETELVIKGLERRSKFGELPWNGRSLEFDMESDFDDDGVVDMFSTLPGFEAAGGLRGTARSDRLWIANGTSLRGEDGFMPFVTGGGMPAVNYSTRGFGYYRTVAQHPLAGVLKDLPSYAPGLQTWSADRLAIVEQAAATKPKSGEVDAEARRLIEKARSLGWEKVLLAAGNKVHPAQRDGIVVLADGSGRFIFDREVGEGLKETVLNDGSTLWHLYSEIGLGAKRTLSRFHQSTIQSLIPWYVPSADDLSVDADVKTIGERTIRITRLKRDEPVAKEPSRAQATSEEASSSKPAAPHQIAVELVFADSGRLSESRVIDITVNKLLAKQTVAEDGTVRVFDADEKLVAEVKYEWQPIEAPNLVPLTRELVILPLPYRSATGVPVSVPVNLQTNAPDFAKLSDDEALQLLATYFAEARQSELASFVEQRFTVRGDHRIGLAVLLASVFPQSPLVANATKQHPESSLARFLEQFAGWVAQGNLNGTLDAGDSASPFLKRVCFAYNHYSLWATDRAATRERPAADIERELAATLLFVRDCRSLDLAVNLLSTVQAALKRTERMNATFARQLNEATAAIAEERGIPAFGRTARIEWLLTVGDGASVAQAKERLRTQLDDAITIGGIPELNGETRSAFVKHFKTADGQPCGPWGELVKEAAHKLVEKKQHFALIELARRCVSLSEPSLAAEIFQLAIKNQDLDANPRLNLAALEYAKESGNWEQAEACVRRTLVDVKLQHVSKLWRDAANIAHHRQKFSDWIESLDRAYELEFAALPKTVNLEKFRQDYESLFGQLEQRAEQLADAKQSEKLFFARLVQRAASRWRDIDVDDTSACHRTARMLTKLGLATAAWNYWTTPLAETPDQSIVWTTFANAMNSEKRFNVADRAWQTAFACEPTNPEILLQHAQFLRSTSQGQRAHELLTRITTSTWQPRFENIKNQAQILLSGGTLPK